VKLKDNTQNQTMTNETNASSYCCVLLVESCLLRITSKEYRQIKICSKNWITTSWINQREDKVVIDAGSST